MLKLASYNIRKCDCLDWRRDPARIAAVLAEIGADIVALQEADRRLGERRGAIPHAALAVTGLRFATPFGVGPSHGWHGNALLVSARIGVERIERLELPCLEPRGALIAEMALEGRRFRLICAHLGLRQISRAQQARAILEALEARADGAHELVLGDLNEWRDRRGCIEILSRRLRPAPTRESFHAARPVARLDRVFASADLRCRRCGVHRSALSRIASDHLPGWAEIAPRRAAGSRGR
ncbi:MAG: endonuclease/exonuclease/phosphatase family protein [Pikeienuella sp.]